MTPIKIEVEGGVIGPVLWQQQGCDYHPSEPDWVLLTTCRDLELEQTPETKGETRLGVW